MIVAIIGRDDRDPFLAVVIGSCIGHHIMSFYGT